MTLDASRTQTEAERIARNTLWNFAGAALPIPVALVCIPVLIASLGIERFGALALAWMVMGYFGLFDFGLSLSTTRFAAADVAHRRTGELRPLLAGSVLLHAGLGLIGGAILAGLAPLLATRVFVMPAGLAAEMETALYWLAASIPAIVVTSALRGMLEGLQRFDVVNLIRIPAAMVNYVAPVVALLFGTTLPLVVGVIVVARYAFLVAYAVACLRIVPLGASGAVANQARMLRLAAFGGWVTVSNLLNPLVVATDRFVIASVVSVAAVAFYATPFEVITKAWILSASLMGALFPVLSGMAERDPRAMRSVCRTAELQLVGLAAPLVALLLGAADLLLAAWLGPEFQGRSTAVTQLLALGILVSIAAQSPLTALLAMGRADVTARIVMAELPLYAAATWYCAGRYGVTGVAAAWAIRCTLDAALLFAAAHRILPGPAAPPRSAGLTPAKVAVLCLFLAAFWVAGIIARDDIVWRCTALAVLLCGMVVWEWSRLLRPEDRAHVYALWNRWHPDRIRKA